MLGSFTEKVLTKQRPWWGSIKLGFYAQFLKQKHKWYTTIFSKMFFFQVTLVMFIAIDDYIKYSAL